LGGKILVLNTIVIALDGSHHSEQIIKALANFKLQPTTKIILSHILSSPGRSDDPNVDRPHRSSEEVYQVIEEQLNSHRDLFPDLVEIEIVNGDPVEEIIRLANIYNADLIIIGNRGLTGVMRVIGSISSQVIAEAPCSVFVVKLSAKSE
jgi:nucleotide-binding universal stress UspA family protein